MRILVTGARGQLGYDVVRCLEKRKAGCREGRQAECQAEGKAGCQAGRKAEYQPGGQIECLGIGHEECDITDGEKVLELIGGYRPDAVIHCASYTNVNKAESEPELCRLVNVTGTENIAKACKAVGAKLIYISTDYVFAGEGEQFYRPEDKAAPINTYGQSKYDGELAVMAALTRYFIVRISWVFGKNGNNFVKTMLRLGKEQPQVRVVCDQFGSPTYTEDLAELLCDMVMTEKYGIYHASNEGVCSWAEFTEEIFRQAGLGAKVVPIRTEEYPTPAARPRNSRMSKQCLEDAGFSRLPDWKDALVRFLAG